MQYIVYDSEKEIKCTKAKPVLVGCYICLVWLYLDHIGTFMLEVISLLFNEFRGLFGQNNVYVDYIESDSPSKIEGLYCYFISICDSWCNWSRFP